MGMGKELLGKQVISLDDGTRLGSVKDIYLDTGLNSVIGLFLGTEGLLRRKNLFIRRRDVTVLGRDAILTRQNDVVVDSEESTEDDAWLRREALLGRLIATSGGTKVGTVGDVVLDGEGLVKGFSLADVYVEGPVAEERLILRTAVLDVGGTESPMTIDLSKAERQGMVDA